MLLPLCPLRLRAPAILQSIQDAWRLPRPIGCPRPILRSAVPSARVVLSSCMSSSWLSCRPSSDACCSASPSLLQLGWAGAASFFESPKGTRADPHLGNHAQCREEVARGSGTWDIITLPMCGQLVRNECNTEKPQQTLPVPPMRCQAWWEPLPSWFPLILTTTLRHGEFVSWGRLKKVPEPGSFQQ